VLHRFAATFHNASDYAKPMQGEITKNEGFDKYFAGFFHFPAAIPPFLPVSSPVNAARNPFVSSYFIIKRHK